MSMLRHPSAVSRWRQHALPHEGPQAGLRETLGEAVLLSLVAVALVEALSRAGLAPPNLTLLLAVVAFVSLRRGTRAGLVSAAIVSLYGVHFFATPEPPFRFAAGGIVPLVILPVTAAVVALIVGDLRQALDESRVALRRELEFRQAIDDSIADGVYAIDRGGRLTLLNPAAARMLGWTEAELRGRVMHDVIHHTRPDGSPFPAAACPGLRVVRDGVHYVTEDDAFIRKDGTMIPVAYSSAPIVVDGEVRGAVVGFRDTGSRKAAEEALRDSEGKLRLLAEQVPAHLWTTDRDLRVTSVSGAVAVQLAIDPGRYVGRALTEPAMMERAHLDPVIAAHREALAGRAGRYSLETPTAVFEARIEPLRDNEGRVVGCIGLAVDVSERRRDERRLETQYEVGRLLAAATDLDDVAVEILRVIGTCLGWTYGALWLVDKRREALRLAGSWTAPNRAYPDLEAANARSRFARGEGLPGRAWASGRPVWVVDIAHEHGLPRLAVAAAHGLSSGFALPIVIGPDVVGVCEFFGHQRREEDPALLDMTTAFGRQVGQFVERKWAEDSLRAWADRQAAVAALGQRALGLTSLEAVMGEAVALVARTLRVEFCKVLELRPDRGELLLRAGVGWQPGAVGQVTVGAGRDSQAGYTLLVGRPVIVDDLRTERRFSGPRLLHDHGVVSGVSVPIPGSDGWFGVLGAHATRHRVFSEEDARFLEGVAVVLSRTLERKALERRLADEEAAARAQRDETARLETLDRLRSTFVQSVSHDLRTPLTASRAALGLLESRLGDRLAADEAQLLANARRNVERLRTLIDDLLIVNQLDAGTLVLDRARLDLRSVVADAVATVEPLVREKGQTLAVDLPEAMPACVDRRQFERTVVNLLANAHAHTPAGTRIAIAGERASGGLRLSVADDGPGIPAVELEPIFGRFHRLTMANGGSGLGLAIARSIVELHGGRLWAESEPGRGSVFRIELPDP